MADVAYSIEQYLLANSDVTDLIGTRMYKDILPQDVTLPAVTYFKISTTHEHDLSDLSGLAHCRIQFDCYDDDRSVANAVAEAIKDSGIVAVKGTNYGTNIRAVKMDDGQRNYIEAANDASDQHRYVTTFDLLVSYTE